MPTPKRSTEEMNKMERKGSAREEVSKAPAAGKASQKKQPESSSSRKSR
ncbi:MAG: hypothetical protein WC635_11105 [Bacteriovorax sp.]|jgi:hypothetical protein